MLQSLLACSAAAPVIIFSFLLIKLNLHSDFQIASDYYSNKKTDVDIERLFESHFEKLISVELNSNREMLSAYVDAKANGTYSLLTMEGEKILSVKKNSVGWSVVQIGSTLEDPLQFVTPLILMLEQKFYN
ncbi:hypothetical protein N180_01065 [Pedobacter antarcticus 4BY]|uniref:Uncharacterized protein n=2 Tax=Pedobacter antarcticus TaxID=34086 RepID=A0A081PC31_9SPHI|nr:hypothetical protein [Pedobacter antarcticus]KEQ28254.1 hypothetical protein N180_01065 [Pedobacter antarcticus 4BY]SFE46770.1 hypothetical protein SAMN03003324_00579 [Pedobacter antarcticus]